MWGYPLSASLQLSANTSFWSSILLPSPIRWTNMPMASPRLFLRSRLALFVWVAIMMTGQTSSHPTGIPSPPCSRPVYGRQDMSTPTSTFDWWPYPSWGAWGQSSTTSTTLWWTPDSSPTPTPTQVLLTADGSPLSTLLTSENSLLPTKTMAYDPLMSSAATSTSSASLVRITALPPVPSASSVVLLRAAAAKQGSGFNFVYLAPLFGILGVVAGALCTWLSFRLLHARRHAAASRNPVLVPGPAYTPPSRFRRAAPVATTPVTSEVGDNRLSVSSGHGLLSANPPPQRQGSWLGRALSSRSRYSAVSAPPEHPAADATDVAEDDPFLDHSTPVAVSRRATTTAAASPRVTSPDPYGSCLSDDDATPYETVRHKSIRRNILDRLRLGTLRRPPTAYHAGRTEDEDATSPASRTNSVQQRRGHRRTHTDASTSIAPLTNADSEETPSRHPSLARARSVQIASPPGFRILVEDPESGALLEDEGETDAYRDSPAASPTPRRRQVSDKFTRMPVRRSTEEKRHSPFSSPSKAQAQGAFPPRMPRVDSSVLPMSPPMVTSPPLESQLFFGSTASLDLQLAAPQAKAKADARRPSAQAGAQDEAHHNKLRTTRPPPPLPFPSTAGSSPFRGKLKKAPTEKAAPSLNANERPQMQERNDSGASSCSTDSTYSRGTPAPSLSACVGGAAFGRGGTAAERFLARKSALSKVDEIVSRSWSARQLAGDAHPGSPNNFGAEGVVVPVLAKGAAGGGPADRRRGRTSEVKGKVQAYEEAVMGMGIEQRLQAFKD